jgi:hypothetical protein
MHARTDVPRDKFSYACTMRSGHASEPSAVRKRTLVACAAFALGNASTNTCPAIYFRLDTEASCEGAAANANKTYGGSGTNFYYPVGCYWHTVADSVFFNTDKGAANFYAQPLCAGAGDSCTAGACISCGSTRHRAPRALDGDRVCLALFVVVASECAGAGMHACAMYCARMRVDIM